MHLSMRVPWMDRPWDGHVCDVPSGNSSCVLLRNIGPKRDDDYEDAHAGTSFDQLDAGHLPPCLSERSPWMSQRGYQVTKTHPYGWHDALSVAPTSVAVPGYAFEAVPFRWLSRESLAHEVGYDRVPAFRPEAEDAADAAIGFSPSWVMDGANQRAVLDAFFAPISADDSLVFTYLKHSPLQEVRGDRLLVGAARINGVTPPPMWNSTGRSSFESCMWETVVRHSLRPSQRDGILLPYQQLVAIAEGGTDVGAALAWAPEGRDTEFSYVTEHLSDDAALQALASLHQAATSLPALGLSVPETALAWLEEQTSRLWKLRGPTPGLAAVLSYLGCEQSHTTARRVITAAAAAGEANPWPLLEAGFADPRKLPGDTRSPLRGVGRVWTRRSDTDRDVLRMLSGMDLDETQVEVLLEGRSDVPVTVEDLLENPYCASTCTYGQREHIPFSTVDRACFPGEGVDWEPLVAAIANISEHQDGRRVEALLTDVLEVAGQSGDTLLPQDEVLAAANAYPLIRSPKLTSMTLQGLELDAAATPLRDPDAWPVVGVDLADGRPALKLARFEVTSQLIRDTIAELRARSRHPELSDPRSLINAALSKSTASATTISSGHSTASNAVDQAEEQARQEKATGLAELYAAPLSVLIGPAGTGKTTLLNALVNQLHGQRVVLLAPTGKARVQLEIKVRPTGGNLVSFHTLASFLARTERFDGERYLVGDVHAMRDEADLVVIDEASMLTEEMLAATLDAFRRIGRLVFVGDPRQLPPIGAGRPFVDLVNLLRPDAFPGTVRVGPGYVELRVPRRQVSTTREQPKRSPTTGVVTGAPTATIPGRRADLELAAWFGDGDLGVDADLIWNELAQLPDQGTVRYENWNGRTPAQVLEDALAAELKLADVEGVRGVPGHEAAFALTYGATRNGEWLNWEPGAGEKAEAWQILSPTRFRAFGSTEINRHIKRTYRTADLGMALKTWRGKNFPAPLGPEQITRGDKVMATRNDSRATAWPAGSGLDYVANGEIGVAIGRSRIGRKKGLKLNVEYSSQRGAQYGYWTGSTEDPKLELAWAVTVHKAQGSEFELTLLVLPARAMASRELLYTALTRQRDRVVILHEGTLEQLRDLTAPWRSETGRRLTDLFELSDPRTIQPAGAPQPQRVDGRVMHVAAGNVVVKSKNEVIVAAILDDLARGRWVYEQTVIGHDGTTRSPDFTVTRADGSVLLWEHLGLMDDLDYSRKWTRKREWYIASGYLPHPQRGPLGSFISTDDRGGVDVPAWRALAQEAIGTLVRRPARRGPGTARRPAPSS